MTGLSLEDSARLVGGHCWAERRLFEITGAWVASTTEPDAKLMLDRHSLHHAWRSEQWWDRLPVVADVDRNALVVPPGPAAERSFEAIEALEGTVGRLAGCYRVAVPRTVAAYRAHRGVAGPIGDGSTIRTLDIVGADLTADWAEGEALLQSLLASVAAVERAAAAVTDVERLLLS